MPFADLHCETISRLLAARRQGLTASLREDDRLHIDLIKLRDSGTMMQNFALFVNLKQTEDPLQEVLTMADLYEEELAQNTDLACPVRSFADLEAARRSHRVGCVLTVEEGGVCRGSLPILRTLYRLGVRMLTLTWNYPNELGQPNGQPGGLTETGAAFISELEALGMIPDVSHLGDDGFWDVCRLASKPFVASHSCCRALWDHPRNLTDPMIRAIADRGGLVGMNYYANFLGPRPMSHWEDVVRHLRHVVDVGGLSAAALGSDHDGIGCPLEWEHAGHLDQLTAALERAGFTPREIDAICWKNVWNLYRELL